MEFCMGGGDSGIVSFALLICKKIACGAQLVFYFGYKCGPFWEHHSESRKASPADGSLTLKYVPVAGCVMRVIVS